MYSKYDLNLKETKKSELNTQFGSKSRLRIFVGRDNEIKRHSSVPCLLPMLSDLSSHQGGRGHRDTQERTQTTVLQ